MYQVIDTQTKGIKGRWTCATAARRQADALNRAYGETRYVWRTP